MSVIPGHTEELVGLRMISEAELGEHVRLEGVVDLTALAIVGVTIGVIVDQRGIIRLESLKECCRILGIQYSTTVRLGRLPRIRKLVLVVAVLDLGADIAEEGGAMMTSPGRTIGWLATC